MSKPEETLAKAVAEFEEVAVMVKARVGAYTRKDGTFVKEHDDGRVAAAPSQPAPGKVEYPPHVKNWADKAHHLEQIPAEKRTPDQKAAYKKASAQAMYGKGHSDEYKAHLAEQKKVAKKPAGGGIDHKKLVDAATYSGGQYEEHDATTTDRHASRSIRVGKDKERAHEHAHDTLTNAGMKPAGNDSITGAHKYESETHTAEIFHNNGTMHVSVKKKADAAPASGGGGPEKALAKAVAGLEQVALLAKARVAAYTRSDGTFVKEHDDGRMAAAPKPAAARKPAVNAGHMDVSTLAAGHHLFDKRGQKVDEVESVEKHPMGGLRVNTRAGYSHMVGKDGSNAHGLTNKAPGGEKKPAGGGYVAPKEGEVGHHEHQTYGKYFRKGDKVKDNFGKTHEVMEHRGAEVKTYGGESFHPTKLHHA